MATIGDFEDYNLIICNQYNIENIRNILNNIKINSKKNMVKLDHILVTDLILDVKYIKIYSNNLIKVNHLNYYINVDILSLSYLAYSFINVKLKKLKSDVDLSVFKYVITIDIYKTIYKIKNIKCYLLNITYFSYLFDDNFYNYFINVDTKNLNLQDLTSLTIFNLYDFINNLRSLKILTVKFVNDRTDLSKINNNKIKKLCIDRYSKNYPLIFNQFPKLEYLFVISNSFNGSFHVSDIEFNQILNMPFNIKSINDATIKITCKQFESVFEKYLTTGQIIKTIVDLSVDEYVITNFILKYGYEMLDRFVMFTKYNRRIN